VKAAEAARVPASRGLVDAVARYLFKLMAYKDEYRSRASIGRRLARQWREFGGDNLRFEFHLAPPLLARPDGEGAPEEKCHSGPG